MTQLPLQNVRVLGVCQVTAGPYMLLGDLGAAGAEEQERLREQGAFAA